MQDGIDLNINLLTSTGTNSVDYVDIICAVDGVPHFFVAFFLKADLPCYSALNMGFSKANSSDSSNKLDRSQS
jgi:hypothetical protein